MTQGTSTCIPLLTELAICPSVTCITAETGSRIWSNYIGHSWGDEWNLNYADFSRELNARIVKVAAEYNDLNSIDQIIKKYPSLHSLTLSGENWAYISQANSTKAFALQKVAEILSISVSDVVAFGDDSNDIEMLKLYGRGISPSNATKQVKAVADEICLSNDEDGVASWIASHLIYFYNSNLTAEVLQWKALNAFKISSLDMHCLRTTLNENAHSTHRCQLLIC